MLQLKQITKTYDTGGEPVHALKGLDLAFRENEFVSILGPSGCGKTTLLNIMGGLDQYSTGDLIINGVSTKEYKDSDWDAYRNHSIGFVFQSYNLISHQTVLSNVELALTLSGVSSEERKKRAIKALEDVGLGDQLNKKPAQLSGGQMQRVAIARALINDPDILLADEPTGALDSATSLQIMALLKKIAEDKLVIMVTHNPDLAKEYSTRIINLSDGLVTGDSNPYVEVTKDSANLKEKASKKAEKIKNKSMSFKTALHLSLNNLLTKKARTILTAFAGSIGIIGIALILSGSNGFQVYIDELERDTLSTYPLSIQSEVADMSAMISAFTGGSDGSTTDDTEKEDKTDVSLKEDQVMAEMFASIGTNDLVKFKSYFESQYDAISPMLNYYSCDYGVKPQLYLADMKYGVNQVCPDSTMSGYANAMASSFVNTNAFYEMMDCPELVEKQYKVLAGKWPKKYNEMVLVLDDEHSLNDFLSYTLGMRNPKELKKMVQKIMNGEEVKNSSKPLEWTYDDILKTEFALIDASKTYKYNGTYNVWQDKSENKSYMEDLIKKSEKVKITGIVCKKEKNASAALSSGIGYLPSLTQYVIDNAQNSEIVKEQLLHQKIDVFSGKSFDSLSEGSDENNLDFSDIVSIDKAKLSSALGGKIDSKKIEKSVTKNIKDALKDADPTEMAKSLVTSAVTQMMGIMADLIPSESSEYNISAEAIDAALAKHKDTGEDAEMINSLVSTYCDLLKNNAPIKGTEQEVSEVLETTLTALTQDEATMSKVAAYTSNMALTRTVSNIPQAITKTATDIGKQFSIDPSVIASAFSMNMDEEEITDLVTAYMSGSEQSTAASNLLKLGYADRSKPISMSFYIKSFDAKEQFLKFIDDYNNQVKESGHEEWVITYTDLTGAMISSIRSITDKLSKLLIGFVAVSLIVSSLMIGIITYISVLERTKEIGILRAIGSSKRDVSRIFNAETTIIGFASGIIGIGLSLLMLVPINKLLVLLADAGSYRAVLPISGAFWLILLSIALTYIAGLFPARIAAKKDPVEALRSE